LALIVSVCPTTIGDEYVGDAGVGSLLSSV
jgi:hypothetical protein